MPGQDGPNDRLERISGQPRRPKTTDKRRGALYWADRTIGSLLRLIDTPSPALAGTAHPPQMLGFEEPHQFDDLGAEMVMQFQDLGRLPQRHPGKEDELVSRPQGGSGLRR